MVAPPQARAGMLVFEKVGLRSVSKAVTDAFRKSLKNRFPDVVFEFDTVVETNAWLEAARLEEMRATYYGWSNDIADSGMVKPTGELTVVLKPEGGGWTHKGILGRLRSRQISPGQILGQSLGEPDQTSVTLEANGRTKTFILGKDGTPRITQLISNGNPPPDEATFRTEALKLVKEHAFRVTGEEWKDAYRAGAWSADRLAVDGGVTSDQ